MKSFFKKKASSPESLQRSFISSNSTSLFSNRQTASTALNTENSVPAKATADVGAPLRVLQTSAQLLSNTIQEKLQILLESLSSIIDQIAKSVLDLSKASIKVHELFKNFPVPREMAGITTANATLGRIVKIALHFIDNLLRAEVYANLRALVLKSFNDFCAALDGVKPSVGPSTPVVGLYTGTLFYERRAPSTFLALSQPQIFPIGGSVPLPKEHKLLTIMEKLTLSSLVMDQEGLFVAPVLRGLRTAQLSILTIVFGFPDPHPGHYDTLQILFDLYPDVHFFIQKNSIKECHGFGFKPPFRVPTNPSSPPMSLSLAASNATALSGTLGGFVYPKIAPGTPGLSAYEGSVFAVTCGHVVLKDASSREEGNTFSVSYPEVSVPSPVLINLYRKALSHERGKYPAGSEESTAYALVIAEINQLFPLIEGRNLPRAPFGLLVWGERTILKTNRLLDLAIIKMDAALMCQNTLGDDVAFEEYDASLMFKNLWVRRVITGADFAACRGMRVFKYGSTSKYTMGCVNGIRMVYWANGKLQTSEFVIASGADPNASSGLFASGGDSGAWILTKLQDLDRRDPRGVGSGDPRGLGVCGMLHSYDGEFKQFGLFTPMEEILARLEEVTNVEWGVVGVDEQDPRDETIGDSDSDYASLES